VIKEAIDRVLQLATPAVVNVDGINYSRETLHVIKPDLEPEPKTLLVHTLTGLVDYLTQVGIEDGVKEFTVVVEDYNRVAAYGPLEPSFGRRKLFCAAAAIENQLRFGQFLDQETFVIDLQSKFKPDGDYVEVLKFSSNVKEVDERTSDDDGISQQVAAKIGIARVTDRKLPNPVTLHPYRTFPEIDPVGSLFVFRAQQGPKFALIDAGGRKWHIDTIQAIRAWLAGKLVSESNDGPIFRVIA
jgi:hypothetical protein